MSKVSVKIVHETKKAKLIQDEAGRKCWVQNKSYKDGLVNEAVIAKNSIEFAYKEKIAQEDKDFKNNQQEIDVVWENEKCVATDVEAEFVQASSMYHVKRQRLFFPKKLAQKTNIGWTVPGWLLIAKINDKLDEMPGYQINL